MKAGDRHSPESIEKMRQARKGKPHKPETMRKISEAVSERNRTEYPKNGPHVRWHANRGIVKTDCTYCIEEGGNK